MQKAYLTIIVGFSVLLIGGCKEKTLHEAIASDSSIVEIERLIINGADVNAKNQRGQTPLHEAAMIGRADVAELLVDNGADINAEDNAGWTPLHAAAANSRWTAAVVQFLISEGAYIHAESHDGATPLHLVMLQGNVKVVRLLIEKGADVNARDKFGSTPLHSAVRRNIPEHDNDNSDAVRLLIKEGANVMARDRTGLTVLDCALMWNRPELASLFLAAASDTPLHYAIRKYDANMVEILLQHGADVNAKDSQGYAPLYVTINYARDSEIVKLLKAYGVREQEEPQPSGFMSEDEFLLKLGQLVDHGGDINKGSEATGITPLRTAAFFGYKKAVEFLLDRGADLEVTDDSGLTALHTAVFHGRLEIANILISHRANLNVQDQHGYTPLHYAVLATSKSLDLTELLIKSGANLNTRNKDGQTPLKLSQESDRKEIAELLRKHGANE